MVTFLVGAAVGVALTLAVIFENCEVETKKSWKEDRQVRDAMLRCVRELAAKNAQLRLSLAAGEMTEDGKKIAAMTMAALDSVIAARKEAIQGTGQAA